MAKCSNCGSETGLYSNGAPICLKCAGLWETKRKPSAPSLEIRSILHCELISATRRAVEATREFNDVVGQFPSGLPHPDGVQRIKNASNKLTVARKEMATAHDRLNDYLSRGIVPDDLKKSRLANTTLGGRFRR
jgi:hypothetical protein